MRRPVSQDRNLPGPNFRAPVGEPLGRLRSSQPGERGSVGLRGVDVELADAAAEEGEDDAVPSGDQSGARAN